MVHAYWNIGRVIVEDEQEGKERADYGSGLLKYISKRLLSSRNKKPVNAEAKTKTREKDSLLWHGRNVFPPRLAIFILTLFSNIRRLGETKRGQSYNRSYSLH